jgi:three-Cys-motif partner protein
VEEDGLYRPEIKRHSLEKIHRHNFYAALFSKAMHRRWHHRVYIGLYAGAGRALVQPGGELVETSALAVLRQEHPFTKYIFVDSDPRCTRALGGRIDALPPKFDVTLITKPVNDAVPDIVSAMPRYDPTRGEGMIALCFVDPFRVDLDFGVIRQLGRYKIDFLVMLPLGYDVRRNLQRYLESEGDDRLGALIDAPDWREQWRAARRPDRHFVRFVMEKFDEAMERLGFRRREMRDTVPVKVTGMGVYLYSLALYTRHELGEQFWKTTIAGTEPQYDMGL